MEMERRDTVIVNGNDLMSKDVTIASPADRFNYFAVNPITYLRELSQQRWNINIILIHNNEEMNKFRYLREGHNEIVFNETVNYLVDQFRNIAAFLHVTNFATVLNQTDFSPASFVIVNVDRQLSGNISRYSPFEIFGEQN